MSQTMKTTLRSAVLVVCLVASAATADAQSKLLTMPDTTAKRGDTLLIPIRVAALATLDSVYAGQFTLSYNSGVMYVYDVSTTGTILASAGTVSFNPTTRQFAFASGTIITGSGPLVYLKVATFASPSALNDSLRLTSALFNEGNPAAAIDNGYFRFRTMTISPKNPAGNLVVGDSLQFSVSGDQQLPLAWSTSSPSFASIDANGKLRGVAIGQVTVYVQDAQGLKDSTSLFPINSALLNSLTLSTHDTSCTQTLTFNLPIYITDVTGLGITSSQFTMTFNSSILQALNVVNAGTMTSSWSSPAYNISGGRIDVAMAGSQSLSGAGVLVYVQFKVLPSASGSTVLTLSNALFNESINSSYLNRTFTALAAPVLVLTPSSATLTRGDTTTIRVTSGGHTPYSWTSNNPAIATINATSGLVTAVARGTTTVTVVDALGFTTTSGSIIVNDLHVALPDTMVNVADSIDVPVTVDLLTGLNLYSYDFRLVYDSTVVKFSQLIIPTTLSSSMSFAVRDTLDTLRVGAAGGIAMSGSGTLLKLRFKTAPGATNSQFSTTRFAFFTFNETGSSTATATPVNGKITIGTVVVSAPPPPVLLSPASSATGVSIAPTLNWNASTGATSYTLQVSTSPTYSSFVVNQSAIAGTSYGVTGLLNNTIYYWRVSATNGGGTSAYSTGFAFTTIIAAPAAPVLVSPASASTGVSGTPTLSWNASATAASYTVEVSANAGFSPDIINQTGVAATSYVAGGLSANTTYYWRVSATNAGGAGSASSAFSFTTGAATPSVPTLVSPASGNTGVLLSPTLSWNASAGATSYALQVSTSADNFSAFVLNQSGLGGTSALIGPLLPNTGYIWRVSATNANSTSAYSSVFNFKSALATPTLLSPHDTATSVTLSPTLTWSLDLSGTTSYTLQVSTAADFSALVVNQSGIGGSSFAVGPLSPSTLYYWRVQGSAAVNTSAYSALFSFTTSNAPPSVPTLTSPASGNTGVLLSPTLSWNASSGATSYRLQVSTLPDFSVLIKDTSGILGTSAVVGPLLPNTGYNWRVSATNANGASAYSSIYNFKSALTTPILLSPHDTATAVVLSPSLAWALDLSGTTSYTLQVSTAADFSTLVVNQGGIIGSSFAVGPLSPDTLYYWRVRGALATNTSAYSAVFSFRTIKAPPSVPALMAPASGNTGVLLRPTLSWSASLGATSYRLQVSTLPDFSVLVKDTSGILDTSVVVGPLLPNTGYNWRVSATNANGTSAYSSVFNFKSALATPTLISPHDTATGVSLTPTMTWSPDLSGTTIYTVEVSTAADFSVIAARGGGTTNASAAIGPLTPDTLYYWRVRGALATNTSAYSAVFSFRTIKAPPAVPTLLAPASGNNGVLISPTLSWNASTGATSYTLHVSTAPDFSALVVNQSGITGTSVVVGPFLPNKIYFWHVSASNAANTSAYSSVFNFLTALTTPTLLSPHDTATGVGLTPTMTWTADFGGTTSYLVEVSTASDFSSIVSRGSSTTGSAFVEPLNASTLYYWRVRGTGSSNTSAYSEVFSFRTINAPPPVPTLSSPASGNTGVLLSPTLSWNASAGATSYTLQVTTAIDNFSTFVVDQSGIGGTSATIGPLLPNTGYNWRVSASNATNTSAYSSVFNFKSALTTPTLLSPHDTATGVSLALTVSWVPDFSGSTTYSVEVSTSSDFSVIVARGGPTTSTSAAIGPLSPGTRYFWRVKAASTSNTSPYSTVWSFRTLGGATAVEWLIGSVPSEFSLGQNFPNPFNPSTRVPYSLPHRSLVRLSVYSMLGSEVAVLVNGERSPGSYEVRFDAASLPSGVYLVKLFAQPLDGGTIQPLVSVKKTMLMK